MQWRRTPSSLWLLVPPDAASAQSWTRHMYHRGGEGVNVIQNIDVWDALILPSAFNLHNVTRTCLCVKLSSRSTRRYKRSFL